MKLAFLLLPALVAPPLFAQESAPEAPAAAAGQDAPEFRPRQVVRSFPAITDPETVPVANAGDLVDDDELVLGVRIGSAARAYPINMLTNPTREIVNDRLGGRAIAATW